jgi:mannose-1-phosphate guanylyltransferase
LVDTALVLVGGEGTRLRPLTLERPKPALPLVDRPFIRYLVDWLERHAVRDVVMACGFRPDALRDALDDGGAGPRIRYVHEPEPLGTAGPIRLAAQEGLLGERFLALNGDVLSDLDLTALMEAHETRGATATIALHPVEDPSSYGLVRRRADGEVLGFVEKPDPASIDTDEVNAGAYVLERSVIDLIPAGRAVSIEREVFPRLVGRGLYGRRLEGYWMDIGTPARFLQASWDILEGRVETDVAPRLGTDGILVENGALVDPTAALQGPALVEAGARVGAGATIGPRAVLGDEVHVGPGATVVESVVMSGARVPDGAEVRGAILGPGVAIEAGSRVGPGEVLA